MKKWVIYDSVLDKILEEYDSKEQAVIELGSNFSFEDITGLEIREVENVED